MEEVMFQQALERPEVASPAAFIITEGLGVLTKPQTQEDVRELLSKFSQSFVLSLQAKGLDGQQSLRAIHKAEVHYKHELLVAGNGAMPTSLMDHEFTVSVSDSELVAALDSLYLYAVKANSEFKGLDYHGGLACLRCQVAGSRAVAMADLLDVIQARTKMESGWLPGNSNLVDAAKARLPF
jgi:hypothetical protein